MPDLLGNPVGLSRLCWLSITFVRQLGSGSMKECHLAIMTFAHVHAQTFDRSVG